MDPALAPTNGPAPATTPSTDDCPFQLNTPPAIDTSEVPKPGESAPKPLPVQIPPIGGPRLGTCGVVVADGMGPIPPKLTSAAWLVADLGTGDVLAAKDPHGRYRPASTIKVLLALVGLEELKLDTPVVVEKSEYEQEGDSCGTGPRGKYTNRDMFSGLILSSGNDCAMVIARQLGGVDETLKKMNAKAKELGALDTRAASPSGLDAPGMSTSAYDLAVIFRAALKNDTFREMIGLRQYHFPGYPPRPEIPDDPDHPAYDMFTSNTLLLEKFPGTIGGKTGFTDDALKTFVGAAKVDDRDVVIVQLYGLSYEGSTYTEQAKNLLRWGGAAPSGASVGSLNAKGGGDSTTTPSPTSEPVARPATESDSDSGFLGSGLVLGLITLVVLGALGFLGRRALRQR
ncbi:MAG: serine hydrolase [Gordonia sp. (in: high G+C Gram-positive bacteria)]